MKLPNAKITNYVQQQLAIEMLIYDLSNNKAYCLNETAAAVFSYCDGTTTFDELKMKHKFSDDLIYLALDELKRQDLIGNDYASPFAFMNRREAVRRVGLASLIALALVTGPVAPTAAQAASGCVNQGRPQRPANLFLGYRSPEFCANDAATCCSNSTRYNPDDSV